MHYSTTGLMLAAMAIGDAVAGPTHAHLHRQAHEKKDVDYAKLDWNNMGIDWTAAWAAGKQSKSPEAAPAAPAAPEVASPVEAAPVPSHSEDSDSGETTDPQDLADDLAELFEGLVGSSNKLSAFGVERILSGGSKGGAGLAGDFENGNIGMPYGSNMMKVSSTDDHDFTATFTNTQSKTITVNVWNKGGSDLMPLSGASLAPKDTALTFVLGPGKSQAVAFMDKSYVAWAQPCSETTMSGSFATTWGEAKFDSAGCGYDMSAISNANGNNYNMALSSNEVECISDMSQNYWLTDSQPIGDSNGSCYVPGSKMNLIVKMGGKV